MGTRFTKGATPHVPFGRGDDTPEPSRRWRPTEQLFRFRDARGHLRQREKRLSRRDLDQGPGRFLYAWVMFGRDLPPAYGRRPRPFSRPWSLARPALCKRSATQRYGPQSTSVTSGNSIAPMVSRVVASTNEAVME